MLDMKHCQITTFLLKLQNSGILGVYPKPFFDSTADCSSLCEVTVNGVLIHTPNQSVLGMHYLFLAGYGVMMVIWEKSVLSQLLITGQSSRHCQRGTTPVLSVVRHWEFQCVCRDVLETHSRHAVV